MITTFTGVKNWPLWDGGTRINRFTHHIHKNTNLLTLMLYRTCNVQMEFLSFSAVKTFGFRRGESAGEDGQTEDLYQWY